MHPSFNLLGYIVRDVITGLEGPCDSICFDLYGCIQACVRQAGLDKDGNPRPGNWYDIKRLQRISGGPVMPAPDFSLPEIGCADKPSR
jgi:hypothetical protein